MQSLTFTPGRAFLSSDSPAVPWTVVFEDEGIAGYFYACDRSQQNHDHSILDAMLIYHVAVLPHGLSQLSWGRRRHLEPEQPRVVGSGAAAVRGGAFRLRGYPPPPGI